MIFRQVPTDPDHNQDAEDDLFYRDTLQELVQVGATLARLVQTQAITDAQATVQGMAPSTPLQEHAATFDRIARAIRRTITLARSLRDPVAPARAPAHPSAAARTPALPGAGQDAAGHAAALAAEREDAKAANEAPGADLHDHPEAPDRDRPERPDRDAPDLDDDDTGRPPAAVIADIRRDLGLDTPPGAHPTTCRTPADREQPGTPAAAPSGPAAGSAYQPGSGPHKPWPQAPWPQGPGNAATQHVPDVQPGKHEPHQLTATPGAQPTPIHPGSTPPNELTPATATIPHHPTHIQERWRPPPNG